MPVWRTERDVRGIPWALSAIGSQKEEQVGRRPSSPFSRRHARARVITRDTVSPANRPDLDAGNASRDVACVVSGAALSRTVRAEPGLALGGWTSTSRSPREVRAAPAAIRSGADESEAVDGQVELAHEPQAARERVKRRRPAQRYRHLVLQRRWLALGQDCLSRRYRPRRAWHSPWKHDPSQQVS